MTETDLIDLLIAFPFIVVFYAIGMMVNDAARRG
jgi:hypothetical protein